MPPESTSPGTERPFCFPVVTRRWPQGPGQAAVDIPRGGAQRPGEHGSEAAAGAPAAGTGGPETDVSGWGEPRVPARPTAQHGGWGGAAGGRGPVLLCPPGPVPRGFRGRVRPPRWRASLCRARGPRTGRLDRPALPLLSAARPSPSGPEGSVWIPRTGASPGRSLGPLRGTR